MSLLGSGDVGTIGIGYGGTGQTSFTAGYVHFGSFSTDSNFFWDNTNKRLGIGTTGPRFPLELVSPGTSTTGLEQVAFFRKTTTNQVGAALFVHDTLVGYGSNAYAGAGNVAVALMSQAAGVGVYTTYGHPSGGVSIGNTTDPGAGVLSVSNGIKFVNGSALVNSTLNDYETGTWTPNQGAGLIVVGAFSSSGSYTKIGNQVTVYGKLTGATSIAISATASVITTNMPFTCASTLLGVGGAINSTSTSSAIVNIAPSSTTVYSDGVISAAASIFFSVTYQTTF